MKLVTISTDNYGDPTLERDYPKMDESVEGTMVHYEADDDNMLAVTMRDPDGGIHTLYVPRIPRELAVGMSGDGYSLHIQTTVRAIDLSW